LYLILTRLFETLKYKNTKQSKHNDKQYKRNFMRSADVETALKRNRPILAMESTLIAHGMPYPENKEFALSAMSIARGLNVVPAVVAVFDGAVHIGIQEDQIVRLAKGKNIVKTSVQNTSYVLSTNSRGLPLFLPLHALHTWPEYMFWQLVELAVYIAERKPHSISLRTLQSLASPLLSSFPLAPRPFLIFQKPLKPSKQPLCPLSDTEQVISRILLTFLRLFHTNTTRVFRRNCFSVPITSQA
jgi:hypothetical protein